MAKDVWVHAERTEKMLEGGNRGRFVPIERCYLGAGSRSEPESPLPAPRRVAARAVVERGLRRWAGGPKKRP